MSGIISITDLSVVFPRPDGDIVAVDGVSVTVRPEERTAIIGETGSGKSILAAAILGLLPRGARVSGSVRYRGEELLTAGAHRLREIRRRHIALIPQSPIESLTPTMPVRRQLSEALDRRRGMDSVRAMDAVHAALAAVGFPRPQGSTHRYACRLSGGLAQRAVVAGATVRRPHWIIADEPTKGLDTLHRAQACRTLASAHRDTGAGLLLITHDLAVARAQSDRVLVMYGGVLIEDAPTHRFFTAPAHPYSRGLLASLPERGMVPIPGNPPAGGDREPGCRFAPRCSLVRPDCRPAYPPINQAGPSHGVRCVLYGGARK
ncbi:MAG: ABC transporter ATP-binding protein [Spirochaetaceae bacterium]|nr:MAG: ABC transporter ATP-binding protein [Spirochaetaceae bacterium]